VQTFILYQAQCEDDAYKPRIYRLFGPFIVLLNVLSGGNRRQKVVRCCFRVQPGNLNRRSGRSDLGSLPDLSAVRHLPVLAPIPRNEAMLLCYKKREELQLLHEQEEHIRRRTFVLRLGDFKVLLSFLGSSSLCNDYSEAI